MRSLDAFLPTYDFSTWHQVSLAVDPALADRALREVTFIRALPGSLATEARVQVPDPVSRRKFSRYWCLVRPFSGIIRMRVLRAAKRRAEAV